MKEMKMGKGRMGMRFTEGNREGKFIDSPYAKDAIMW